uniref:Uncharacterized protein n=1 Tax=Fibrocapsa japonica TaxID=94617 RepID=A0A7S2UYM4_9STRA|mmetsp:Transcript_20295/g.29347  ORF Transcript_20295/g.29347 Transcript_20295/m.29347 type:complete len:396 (+) Transcript_20295:224-1411(+)|eukprot:CAMPEP_0113943448 /NCGR_PEP_ID=MMETSP1339-20121228/23986_1 /TAXON_ID=94617 /ORGANISM="Fibrocapsa japonica" /LENGTH=395 /DNA_ID=CAMNT_0000948319 /DNA_START=209 /DNA_END=1396 /DNA_ORIENTATION=+ /assembly_acc=CAM_ASM_000762
MKDGIALLLVLTFIGYIWVDSIELDFSSFTVREGGLSPQGHATDHLMAWVDDEKFEKLSDYQFSSEIYISEDPLRGGRCMGNTSFVSLLTRVGDVSSEPGGPFSALSCGLNYNHLHMHVKSAALGAMHQELKYIYLKAAINQKQVVRLTSWVGKTSWMCTVGGLDGTMYGAGIVELPAPVQVKLSAGTVGLATKDCAASFDEVMLSPFKEDGEQLGNGAQAAPSSPALTAPTLPTTTQSTNQEGQGQGREQAVVANIAQAAGVEQQQQQWADGEALRHGLFPADQGLTREGRASSSSSSPSSSPPLSPISPPSSFLPSHSVSDNRIPPPPPPVAELRPVAGAQDAGWNRLSGVLGGCFVVGLLVIVIGYSARKQLFVANLTRPVDARRWTYQPLV